MNRFWSLVTAFGTLWGGIELTLGTFLHVLRVPKTGLMMTALGIVLLTAQRQILPARGATLCVGIVAASIKCLSPGGIILGPVFGILSQALIIELLLLLGPRRLSTALLAGGFALVWSQLQSIFQLWIYYGNSLIESVAKVITKFFAVEWTANLAWSLLGGFFVIIFGLGLTMGGLGWRLGRRALVNNPEKSDFENNDSANIDSEDFAHRTENSLAMIATIHAKNKREPDAQIIKTRKFMAMVAVLTLILQFNGELLSASLALGMWFLALFWGARRVIQAIWWPKFWLLTLTVSLLSGAILAWDFDSHLNWRLGLEATAAMMIRGLYVFSLLGWATRCLRTQELLTIWDTLHLPKLGLALAKAYELLPNWLERMNTLVKERPAGIRNILRYAYESLVFCLTEASRGCEK